MSARKLFVTLFFSMLFTLLNGQTGTVKGIVSMEDMAIEFAQVVIDSGSMAAVSNFNGEFIFENVPYGKHQIFVTHIGYENQTVNFILDSIHSAISLKIILDQQTMKLDDIVITGTKTPKRKTNSPVIVNVVNSQTIDHVQACNLSDALKFQPGLRVETDCQTCNYTQLRMNGLGGGYSQILINGRPIFSPLTGLYGLEQLPANMIDRIEVVRGGGSALYGSSAIGGTVNVITKTPVKNSYELNYTYQNIGAQTSDHSMSGNASLVTQNKKSGLSFFLLHRSRNFYDDNDDNFSEIPLMKNTSLGTNLFFLPSENQKLELNLSYINEYRFGGEMVKNQPPHLTQQSEERLHNVWMASADYQINFNNSNSSFIAYMAMQQTDRKHYTGIMPDTGTTDFRNFLEDPPYGTSYVKTYNIGTQINHNISDFLRGNNVLTIGMEYLLDDVFDNIPSYNYLIDQTTKNFGLFFQSDWAILPQLTLLSGLRMDKHNFIDKVIFNPRVSLLYKLKENTQFRFSYGTGFRAPQSFDADLHIAFAGGGVSRIFLSPSLQQEKSQSFSGSINYDKPMENYVFGFTLEGFYTRLNNAFYLQPIGEDQFGELFEKQNGDGATVRGMTIELRANYKRKIQLESGFTLQSSKFDRPVEYIDGLEGIREFTRTPNDYGYAILTFSPTTKFNLTFNYLYTGKMKVPHFAGAVNQSIDEIVTSEPFSELSAKLGYTFTIKSLSTGIEVYGGVKNIFNAFQNDFDMEKNRDSNYIYGPAQPRCYFVGLKFKPT